MPLPKTPPFCPVCGEELSPNAKACSRCGACHHSGWTEEAHLSAFDLPEEEFDYDEFLATEFGAGTKKREIKLLWWLTALLVLIALFFMFLLPILT